VDLTESPWRKCDNVEHVRTDCLHPVCRPATAQTITPGGYFAAWRGGHARRGLRTLAWRGMRIALAREAAVAAPCVLDTRSLVWHDQAAL
jgi:hypothetical protein